MHEVLKGLNPSQREAVQSTDGPVLIIAGAGSGKTRMLTHRVAYLIKEKKIKPQNILAVTFTNKAAGEMKERIGKLLATSDNLVNGQWSMVNGPYVGTFHSICAKILRREIDKIGYKRSFNIIDEQDHLALAKKIFKKMELSPNQFNPSSFLHHISKAKNELVNAKRFEGEAGGYFEEIAAKFYQAYQAELKNSNSLDFDDLIMLTAEIFKKFPEVLEKYQRLFRYILVDEYQDTNHAQYVLVNLLAEKHRNLCVVGDDWQSIYLFRGADVKNILDFEKDYPEAKIFKLEQNYRSTQAILDAAYGIISKNIFRKDKKLWTEKKEGHLITSYEAEDEEDEAEFVAEEIIKSGNKKYSDFVVLYRTNAQSRVIEEIFLNKSIPYRIVGGIKFYQRKEIKDVVAYLKLINNFSDAVSLERIINEPRRGIGEVTLSSWINIAKENSTDPISMGLKSEILNSKSETNSKLKIQNSKFDSIIKFCDFIKRMNEISKRLKLADFIEKVYRESGYEKYLNDGTIEGETRHENARELLSVARKFEGLEGAAALEAFLEEVALASDTDKIDQNKNSVHLMTLHSAKGLEFACVFIVGLEEGILPHSRSMLSPHDMEEERRLMYVGITRAKEKVYLLFTSERNIFGSTQMNSPSRFLDDIPPHLLQDAENKKSKIKSQNYNSKFKNDILDTKYKILNTNIKDGDRVRHDQFGEGLVISVKGDTASLAFKKAGLKKLSLEFAKLKKIK